MTTITIKCRAVFVGSRCIESDARTRDDAYRLAISTQSALSAIGQESEIVFGGSDAK